MRTNPEFLDENYGTKAVTRWAPLLEGIRDPYRRMTTARLLDNQAAWNQEAATTTADIAPFTRISLPLIRRIYPSLIANDLVSIQPISQPTGKIFYLDFEYASNVAPVAIGDRNDYQAGANPGDNIRKAKNYTKGFARGAVVGTGDNTNKDFLLPGVSPSPYTDSTFTPVRDNANLKVYVNAVAVTVVTTGTPSSGQVKVDLRNGKLTFGTAPANAAAVTADFDLRIQGDDSRIPELKMKMSDSAIAAETRKLKVRWELEAEQDFYAYHGLSLESELISHAADEVSREIDREIIDTLLANAGDNVNWDTDYDPTSGNPGEGYSRKEYNETLVHAILDAEQAIYEKRLVRANWIVVGPAVASRLEKLNTFRLSDTFDKGNVSSGPHVFGVMQNRFRVIMDPLFAADKILVGHKGASFQETGFVYAPYVGLMTTPRFMDPNDFTPRRGLMRRDAAKLISGDFYATVTLQ